jgi:hypothetical protein
MKKDAHINGPLILSLMIVLTGSCSNQNGVLPGGSPGTPSQGPGAGSEVVTRPQPVGQVTFPSGRVFFVDLALTPEQQARGYMGRKVIAPEEGLLFLYMQPGIRTFWMKNCLTTVDMIWLDSEERVVYIEHSAPPCRMDPCPSYGPGQPTLNVLEIAGGTAAQEGLQAGDRLQILTDLRRP